MRWTPRVADPLFDSLDGIVRALGMVLLELVVSHQKSRVQVRLVIYKNGADVGTKDCSMVHRALLPRLDLAFGGKDVYMEVASPGIDRVIKDGSEFVHYIGRTVRCYIVDVSDWVSGTLAEVSQSNIILKTGEKTMNLTYDKIAKARLCSSAKAVEEAAL
ncbi:ribosome maturation factor RimP [Spirochaetia bacterium]|nr:ribosome maturation factor RimP [Spirochaetia bacterium]